MALGWDDLIDENAEVKLWVVKAMARRHALHKHGEISPMSLREALLWVNDRIPMLIRRKRKELGLPVDAGTLIDVGVADGFGREA